MSREYRKPTPPSTSKPPAPPKPGTRAASQPKPGSRLQTPVEPTADHLSALPAACRGATSENAPNPGRSPHHGLVSFSHHAFPPAPIPEELPGMGIIRPPHPSIMHPMYLYLHPQPPQ
ncbi:inverted formin-2-like [Dermacentor silvarum]|uniref:inverted formin-2-like n=1 Tax=Dermacentor silvarum TaxID=543639 RepID=UPI00189C1F21|nr:inverted formin-2-like [Dermacentor silvarum]